MYAFEFLGFLVTGLIPSHVFPALILVKGDGNGSTAIASAGTLPAWMAYVFTILVAVVIGACSVWSQKKAGKAGRK